MPDNLSQIINIRSVGELIRDSLHEITPVKGNLLVSFGILLVALMLSVNVIDATNSIEIFIGMSVTLRDVFLGLFGVALSIFAIFFSLLDGAQIYRLTLQEDNPLIAYLLYYENVLVLFALAFILSLSISLFDYATVYKLASLICHDRYLEIAFCLLYLAFSFRIVFETKSLLFNTFTFTRACICLKGNDAKAEILTEQNMSH